MNLKQNNVKYKLLNSGSNQIIQLWFLCFRYTLYVPPKVSVPILDRFRGYAKIRKIRFFFGHETQSFINIAPSCTREKPNIMTCSTFPSATWR